MANGLELATAYVNLTVSAKDVGSQTRKAFSGMEKDADRSGKRAGKNFSGGMGSAFKGLAGMFAGAMAGLAVGNFLKDSVAEARESQKVGALTANVIKVTGSAAKVTTKQVGDLATAISNKTGIDDEAIQTGANLLLTFKNVRNEAGKGSKVFDRATQAAVDLSAAGFGSVDGAAKMLGKALNDPIKGISALGRAGVTFTDGQKKQIKEMVKVGDVLGAQKIIMGEVESQVGGAAAASATAGEKLAVVWGNFKETIGTAMLPMIDKLANFLSGKLLPAAVQFFDIMFKGDFSGGPLSEDSKVVDTLFRIRDAVKYAFGVTKQFFGILFQGDFKKGPLSEDSKVVDILFKLREGLGLAFGVAKQFFGILFQGDFKSGPLSEDGKFVDVLFKVRDGFFTVRDGAVALGGWLKNNLWPALKDAYQTILPGITKAFGILQGGKGSGGVGGAGEGFKKFGDILTEKVIPFIALLISHWLPLVALNLRSLMETVKLAWQSFQKWKDVVLAVVSTIIRAFLNFVGVFINGAAKAFGWIPGIGPKLKSAAKEFNKFRDQVNGSLDGINDKTVSVGVKFAVGSKLAYDARHQGIANGGLVRRAAGGIIPGPWRGPKADNVLGVSDFGVPTAWVNPDEFITKVASTRKMQRNHPGALEYINRYGELPSHAGGGFAAATRLPTRKGIDEGVDSATLDVVAKSAKMLQQAMGGPGMGWRAMVAWAKANIPGVAVTSTVRRGDKTSDHYSGRAIDLAGGPGMSRIFDRISGAFPTSNVRSLYYSPKGGNQIRFNRRSNTPPHIYSSHFDHVHWAMNNGGMVPGRESGGPVLAGRPYVVGEKRPELFVPDTNGTILPSVGAGGTTVFQTFLDGKVVAEVVMDHTGRILSGGRTVLAS